MDKKVASFFKKHKFVAELDVSKVAFGLMKDMQNGLKGNKADEDMIRTFCLPPEKKACNESVIVIDAGGTNFRSCLVTFDANGEASISEMEKTRMPGIERELSRVEFFDQIASNLEHLKNKANRIGFCFSYPMTITEDGDGILLGFSKEVKAPEVVGAKVGECLVKALEEKGWNKIERITLCNDTVAALLAGASVMPSTEVSSYIGMILGTGLNAAYIQESSSEYNLKRQIIVCESGKYTGVQRSEFDIMADAKTVKPGTFLLEKSCSGAYLGPIGFYAITTAAKEGLFSSKMNEALLKLESLSLIELSGFLEAPYNKENVIGKICAEFGTEEDYGMVVQIFDAVVERSACYGAAILIACARQTGMGKNASKPVCILCNGTTFFKTPLIRERVYAKLDEILTHKESIYWKIVSCENDITLGAAISGLI